MQNIVATYDLPVEDAEAPALPEGIERDPVQFREDLSDAADPFGFVTMRVDISSEGLSKADRRIGSSPRWRATRLPWDASCKPMTTSNWECTAALRRRR